MNVLIEALVPTLIDKSREAVAQNCVQDLLIGHAALRNNRSSIRRAQHDEHSFGPTLVTTSAPHTHTKAAP